MAQNPKSKPAEDHPWRTGGFGNGVKLLNSRAKRRSLNRGPDIRYGANGPQRTLSDELREQELSRLVKDPDLVVRVNERNARELRPDPSYAPMSEGGSFRMPIRYDE